MSIAVTVELARLQTMTTQELRTEWRRVFKHPPPQFTQDMLLRALAWQMQERVIGGLTPAVAREIRSRLIVDGWDTKPSRPSIKPGTRLVRSWQGRTHRVLALENGFEHQGRCYGSLSAVAEAITGTRWSGPRFFGLGAGGEGR